MQVSDKMVKVARRKYESSEWDLPSDASGFPTGRDQDAAMRAALEAALNAAGDAPTDAEFEAALDEWFKAESAANWYRRNGLVGHFTADERAEAEARWELVIAEAESTRQRILTLYANARNAGLREAKRRLGQMRAQTPPTPDYTPGERMIYRNGYDIALLAVEREIDAILKGGDGEKHQ